LKALLFANTDWYLYNFRLPLAKALRSEGYEVVLLSPPGDYAGPLMREGFRWIAFPFSRKGVNPISELVTLWRLVRLYRSEQPDLVHHFTIKCVLYGGIAARWSRARAIVSAVTGLGHVFTTDSWRNRLLRPLVSLIYRLVFSRSQIVFQNPDDRSDFLRLTLVRENQAHLIRGSGADIDYFSPRVTRQAGRPLTVLMVGRLLQEKGVREFVEAAEIVRGRMPDVCFLLAGGPDPGNPSSIDPAAIAVWQQKGHVTFLGHREGIRDLLRDADLAVLPSYREGAPLSLIEAAACGLPLVATDVPGCREVVFNKVNGLLVPPRDSQGLADAILELLLDGERRLAMGEQSRRLACHLFSQDRVIRETMNVYAKALIG
jgi:glycosyltransferase involved in cell wall biosynthesis